MSIQYYNGTQIVNCSAYTFTGSVGIGTTNPQASLDVWGSLKVSGNTIAQTMLFPITSYSSALSGTWNGVNGVVWYSAFGTYNTTTGAYIGSSSTAGYSGEYFQHQYSYSIKVTMYNIASMYDGYAGRRPKTWKLFGSNDGSTWYVVDDRNSSAVTWNSATLPAFSWIYNLQCSNPGFYSYYRIVINSIYGNSAESNVAINWLNLFCLPSSQPNNMHSTTVIFA